MKQGKNVIKAHLLHLKEHNQPEYLREAMEALKEKNIEIPLPEIMHVADKHLAHSGCPGAKVMEFGEEKEVAPQEGPTSKGVPRRAKI